MNRVLIENSSSTPYVDIQYEYDYLNGCVCGASIGRLTEVSTGFNGTSYYYDWTGRLYYEDHNIPGMSINSITSYQYDRQGNPTYVVYPDNSFLWHSYHNSGDLQQLYLYENDDSGWQTVIQNINYGPSGKSEYVTYANSVTSNINYDQDYNYRLKSILTYSPSNYYQDLDYQYDDVGNILRLDDFAITPAARSVLYTYDDLYRLLSASTTAVASGQNYKETFTYNTIGNILTDSGTNYSYLGSSGSNYANPHAATQIGSNVNTYDTAGRLLTNGFLKNTWNYRDQLMQVVATKGTTTSTSTYTYNHEGSRITSTVGATTTFYLNKYYTVNSQGVKNKYIYAGDKLVAVVENGGGVASSTSYHHSDHLGSTGVVTNESGDLIQTVDYYPFGNERLNVASSTYRAQKQYIGEYYEKSNELSYLNARYYDASGSRFLSQDPVFWSNKQNLMDPQTLNSYSYASNNPINNMDPTGLATVKGSLEETQKALIKVLKSYISLLESVKSNPGGAAKSLARSAGSTAKNVVLNPGGMAYNAAASTRNSINTFRNGSDAVQDQMIGNGVAGLAGLLLPKGVKRIPDDALVVRGGGRSNQSANSINQAIAKSEAQGGVGFSANCSGVCTSISQINLLDKRPNPTLSVVTAGDVRAMGGDVIPTYGGTHVSVINISGNAASTLPWVEVDNPYY